jgi:lysozyme|tara:strand:- start:1247 stop:1678 length:432 start_codon:yes stop_codon:yes gene_type:complete
MNFIKRHEGLRLIIYICPAGKRTIFWGRNIDDNPFSPDEIVALIEKGATTEVAEMCLKRDLEWTISSLRNEFADYDNFSKARKIALASVMFNLGRTKFMKFKFMISAIRHDDWVAAGIELLNSKRGKQLKNRTEEEMDMLIQG